MSMSFKAPVLQSLRIQYDLKTFIETGTYDGAGVYQAIIAGFERIHSIEASRFLWIKSVNNIGGSPGVFLHLGDSGEELHWVFAREQFNPCLIALDAHTVPGLEQTAEIAGSDHPHCPLLNELECLYQLRCSYWHVVLVDDIDMAGTAIFDGITKDQILAQLLRINPGFQFTYVDGARPESLLIAAPSRGSN